VRSARLLLDKGRIHGRLGEHEAALASFEQALAGFEILADAPADLELEIELLHGKAVALRDLGQADAAFEAARGALKRASDAGLDSQRAFLLNQLAMAFYARGGQERARRLARRSLAAASQAREPRLEVLARNTLAMVAWKTGDTGGALDLFTENLAACERMNDPWGQLPALNNLGILHCSLGDWRSARDLLAKGLAMKRRLGAREGEALTRINLAEVEEVLGDWRRAQRHVERALALLADQRDHPERIAATTQLASLARKRGDLDRADELLVEAQRSAEGTGDRDLVLRALLERGLLELDRKAHGPAGEALERGLELARESGSRELEVRHLTALAQLGLAVGDRAAAARRATLAREVIEGSADDLAEGRLAALEGQLAALADDGSGAETAFERSARLLSEVGAVYDQARTLHRWGLATWNAELAVERLERALDLFQQLGAAADAHEVRSALARIGDGDGGAASRSVDGTLYEVAKVINSSLDLPEVLDRTMDLVLGRLGAERGMIVLVDPLTQEMDVAVARNLGGGAEESKELSESVVRRVIETHEPVLAVDAVSDSRFVGAESIVARHILSILCVPLAIRDRLAGAIYIDHRESKHLFTDADRDFLMAFADGAAVAIENARLYGQLEEARKRLESENASLKREIFTSHHLGTLIGKSRAISALKGTLELVAQGASTVLIRGESGTGKGLVARIIHNISPRRKAPFVHFNCAALPETLVESELFGHEKGAFTGASSRKPGRFELADGGTIFLDEIGKVSRSVQAKLLRVVEDKEFERVGGTKTLSSDVRIIAATNLNLEQAIARDEFREDLYYRLNIIPIILPPLRERREDVPYLVQHFLERIGRDLGLAPKDVDPAVLDLFARHDWPGNVRELEAAIHRALVLTPGDTLAPDSFAWIQVATGQTSAAVVDAATLARSDSDLSSLELADGGYQALLDELDGQLIRAALTQSDGKIREAARLLGIARNTLKAKLKKFGIEA
jgi:Nif-specific regulatory protein